MADLSGMFKELNSTINQHPLAQQYDASVLGMAPSPMDKIHPLLRNMLQGGTRALGGTGDFATSQEKQATANTSYGEAVTNQDPKALRAAAAILVKQGRIPEAQQAMQMADQIQQKRNALLDEGNAEIQANVQTAKKKQLAERMAQMTTDPEIKNMLRTGALDPEETAKALMKARIEQKDQVLSQGAVLVRDGKIIARNPKDDDSTLETAVITRKDDTKVLINKKTGTVIANLEDGGSAGMDPAQTVSTLTALGGVRNTLQKVQDLIKDRGVVDSLSQPLLEEIPYTDSKDIKNLVKTLTANLGFDALQDLKQRGGTLGQIAVAELEALQSTITSLDPKAKNFKDSILMLAEKYDAAIAVASGAKDAVAAYDWDKPEYSTIPKKTIGDGRYVKLDGGWYKFKEIGGK